MKTTPTYKAVHLYKSPIFNVYSIEKYRLAVILGKMYFSVVAVEPATSKCVLWEHYEVFNADSPAQAVEAIKGLVSQHFCLNAGFWNSVSVAVSSDQFCFVPSAYFDESSKADYLRLNAHLENLQSVESMFLSHADAYHVFAIDERIRNFWQMVYPQKTIKFSHQIASFLLSLQQIPSIQNDQYLHLLLQDGGFYAIHFKKNQFDFANWFKFGTVQDFLYYVLLLVEQLGLDARSAQVWLYGNISKKSDLYAHLSQYLDKVQFGTTMPKIELGTDWENLPVQQVFGTLGLLAV